MAFIVTVVAGKTFVPNETVELPELNLLGLPTINVAGDTRDLGDISTTAPTDGQILVWSGALGEWVPTVIPVSTSDIFNRIFSWEHFI